MVMGVASQGGSSRRKPVAGKFLRPRQQFRIAFVSLSVLFLLFYLFSRVKTAKNAPKTTTKRKSNRIVQLYLLNDPPPDQWDASSSTVKPRKANFFAQGGLLDRIAARSGVSHRRSSNEPLKLRDLVDGSVTGGGNLLGEKWEDGTKWEDSREQEAEVAVVSGLEEAVQETRVQEGAIQGENEAEKSGDQDEGRETTTRSDRETHSFIADSRDTKDTVTRALSVRMGLSGNGTLLLPGGKLAEYGPITVQGKLIKGLQAGEDGEHSFSWKGAVGFRENVKTPNLEWDSINKRVEKNNSGSEDAMDLEEGSDISGTEGADVTADVIGRSAEGSEEEVISLPEVDSELKGHEEGDGEDIGERVSLDGRKLRRMLAQVESRQVAIQVSVESLGQWGVAVTWKFESNVPEASFSLPLYCKDSANPIWLGGGSRSGPMNLAGKKLFIGSTAAKPAGSETGNVPFLLSSSGFGFLVDLEPDQSLEVDLQTPNSPVLKLTAGQSFKITFFGGSSLLEVFSNFQRAAHHSMAEERQGEELGGEWGQTLPPLWAFSPIIARKSPTSHREVVLEGLYLRQLSIPASVAVIDYPQNVDGCNDPLFNESRFDSLQKSLDRLVNIGFSPILSFSPCVDDSLSTTSDPVTADDIVEKDETGNSKVFPGGILSIDFRHVSAAEWLTSHLTEVANHFERKIRGYFLKPGPSVGEESSGFSGKNFLLFASAVSKFLQTNLPGNFMIFSADKAQNLHGKSVFLTPDETEPLSMAAAELAAQNSAMSALPLWGPLASFQASSGSEPTAAAEMIRWIQLSSILPVMVLPSSSKLWRSVLAQPQWSKTVRRFSRLHFSLAPYFQRALIASSASLSHGLPLEHSRSGNRGELPGERSGRNGSFEGALAPLLCPLVVCFEREARERNWSDYSGQFLVGSDILVGPFVEVKGTVKVRLPRLGQEKSTREGWVDFWRGECFKGGQTLAMVSVLSEVPIFVKAGAILELLPESANSAMTTGDTEGGEVDEGVRLTTGKRVIQIWPSVSGGQLTSLLGWRFHLTVLSEADLRKVKAAQSKDAENKRAVYGEDRLRGQNGQSSQALDQRNGRGVVSLKDESASAESGQNEVKGSILEGSGEREEGTGQDSQDNLKDEGREAGGLDEQQFGGMNAENIKVKKVNDGQEESVLDFDLSQETGEDWVKKPQKSSQKNLPLNPAKKEPAETNPDFDEDFSQQEMVRRRALLSSSDTLDCRRPEGSWNLHVISPSLGQLEEVFFPDSFEIELMILFQTVPRIGVQTSAANSTAHWTYAACELTVSLGREASVCSLTLRKGETNLTW